MTRFLNTLLTLFFLSIAGLTMAQTADTADTEFNMDFQLSGGTLDLRVNDVPVFGPGEPLVAEGSIISSFPLNAFVYDGPNIVSVAFTANVDAAEPPKLCIRLEHISIGSFPPIFEDRPFAIDLFIPGSNTRPYDLATGSMPSMTGRAEGPIEDGTVTFTIEVDSNRPAPQWVNGQPLKRDTETFSAVLSEMQRAHQAFAAGRDAVEQQMRPLLRHAAGGFGLDVGTFLDLDYSPFVDPSLGYELQPFDAGNSELMVFGNGRLATLVPSPIVFLNEEYQEEGVVVLYFWKDEDGAWRLMK